MPDYRPSPLKRKIASGGVGVIANGLNTSAICDFLGQFGFDAAFVDFEHGDVSWSELADISRACDLWGMTTLARVNRLDEAQVLRALDQGAQGVFAPHVITVEDAELLAKSCRYPPDGIRGVAGSRRAYGVQDYFRRSNEEVMAIALIEDAAAVRNIRELVKVDGVDVFYVAPSDLAASMGHTGNPGHADVQAAINTAIAEVVKAGRVAGTLVNDGNVSRYIDQGVRCVGVGWQAWVASGAAAFMKQVSASTSAKPAARSKKR
jgi:4-hydroxy-2-oxoheptanedioate aldolase